jgi:hypothetical protein
VRFELVLAGKTIATHAGLEVARMNANDPSEVDRGEAAAAYELANEGAAEVEDFGDFTGIEGASWHVAPDASRRQMYMEGGRGYCGRMVRFYRTDVRKSRAEDSTE